MTDGPPPSPSTHGEDPAWRRTYRVVWVANLVTAVGMMSFLPFFPSYLRELGVEGEESVAAWTGVIVGAAPLAAAFLSPIWGALGDRFGRKLMVLRAMTAISLFVGGMGLVETPLQLLALRLCQGVFSGFIPPSITLVSVGAPEDRQGSVAGSLQAAMAVGTVVGPILGASVSAAFGMRATFATVSMLAALSGLLVLVFAKENRDLRGRSGEGRSPLAVLRGTWRELGLLFANPRLRAAVTTLFWVQFGLGATTPLLELYVESLWQGDPARVRALTGALVSALALTNIVAMPLWGKYGDRRGHPRALRHAALWSAGGLAAHALTPSVGLLFPARLLLGGASAGAGPATFGVAAEETPPERRGGAFGAVFSARAMAVAVSASCGGLVAGWIGIRGLFLVGALLMVAAAIVAAGSKDGGGRARDGHER